MLTKTDTVDENQLEATRELLQKETGGYVYATSILDDASIKQFRDQLVKQLREQANSGKS